MSFQCAKAEGWNGIRATTQAPVVESWHTLKGTKGDSEIIAVCTRSGMDTCNHYIVGIISKLVRLRRLLELVGFYLVAESVCHLTIQVKNGKN